MKTDLLLLIEKFIADAKALQSDIEIDLTVRNIPIHEIGHAITEENIESHRIMADSIPNERDNVAYLKVSKEVTFISNPLLYRIFL